MEQTSLFLNVPEELEGKSVEATRPQEAQVVRSVGNPIQFLVQDLDELLTQIVAS